MRVAVFAVALAALLLWLRGHRVPPRDTPAPAPPVRSEEKPAPATTTAAEKLLEDYGDPGRSPLDDLRALHRVTVGYFSVIKDPARFPIGGNEDLAAALRGENPNREVFVPPGHPVYLRDGRLGDRWGGAIIVHPLGWKQLELRSPGPDGVPHTDDDLALDPKGNPATAGK